MTCRLAETTRLGGRITTVAAMSSRDISSSHRRSADGLVVEVVVLVLKGIVVI